VTLLSHFLSQPTVTVSASNGAVAAVVSLATYAEEVSYIPILGLACSMDANVWLVFLLPQHFKTLYLSHLFLLCV